MRTISLAATLGDMASGVIVDLEHRDEAVRVAVGASDVAPRGADLVHGETDAPSGLADQGGVLQSVVDALDTVVKHLNQETARKKKKKHDEESVSQQGTEVFDRGGGFFTRRTSAGGGCLHCRESGRRE